MIPQAPQELLAQAAAWEDLSRWERAELGRALRELGWSYGEIRQVIDVPKGTLAGWCRGIRLSDRQVEAIRTRTGSVKGVPRDTQRRRRREIDQIRATAAAEVPQLIHDPLWLAGTVMYWAEGAKSDNALTFANSDPRACRLFIEWTRGFHRAEATFVLKLNIHAGNDESAARAFWLHHLALNDDTRFYRTYVKADGTGHRKNHLAQGVAQVRVRASTDLFHTTMGWIDRLAIGLGPSPSEALLISRPGR